MRFIINVKLNIIFSSIFSISISTNSRIIDDPIVRPAVCLKTFYQIACIRDYHNVLGCLKGLI